MFKVDLAQEISLEARRQQALFSAESCIKLLKEMGATEVLLCGSLAGQSPWHWHSDLDLAVRGMSKSDVWDAYSAVEEIVPHWLEVDIIPLEFAPSFLTERILSKTPMPDNKYVALKLRIRDEMNSLEITIDTLNGLLQQQEIIPEVSCVNSCFS